MSGGAPRWMKVYSPSVGVAYLIFGLMELLNAVYTTLLKPGAEVPLIGLMGIPPGDWFGALSSILIGILLLMPLLSEGWDALAYMLGGTLLSAVFGALYLLILGSSTLSALLAGGEELRAWLAGGWLGQALRPEIWLAVGASPLTAKVWLRAREAGR